MPERHVKLHPPIAGADIEQHLVPVYGLHANDVQPKYLDIDPNQPTKELEWTVLALFRLYVGSNVSIYISVSISIYIYMVL